MTVSISGKEARIDDLFSRDFVFRIPPYQRPYAWETAQAGELLTDLLEALGDVSQAALDHVPPYFLGSIVVIKAEGKPESDVVDGQQRLTTLTLLLAALRAEIDDPEMRTHLRGLIYEPENRLRRTPARYRLSLRERDEDFFRKHVQNDGALDTLPTLNLKQLSDSQRNLVCNAMLLRERVQELSPERRILLAQYLVGHCFLVVVSTPTFESAYRIFSVLNDRGLDLSPSPAETRSGSWTTCSSRMPRRSTSSTMRRTRATATPRPSTGASRGSGASTTSTGSPRRL